MSLGELRKRILHVDTPGEETGETAMAQTETVKTYGSAPFRAAVIHGGPGAIGEMATVARELSSVCGMVEPLFTATSIDGQVRQLRDALETCQAAPAALIGHSWGAWLAVIFAARHPESVSKLILAGSGPFEACYASLITETRLRRLSEADAQEARAIMESLNTGSPGLPPARLGELMASADTFDPLPPEPAGEHQEFRPEVLQSVWPEANALRKSGELLGMLGQIRCPVVAIHGDYDPHPAEGVRIPLLRCQSQARFVLLKDCGHDPWMERAAKEEFYDILRAELSQDKMQ